MRRVVVAALLVHGVAAAQTTDITVYAAGSLRTALTQIAQDYETAHTSAKVTLVFGASGLLKDRLQAGERADVLASANMEHPQALVDAGLAKTVQRFARNALCALAAPTFSLRGQALAQRLLDPAVKVGTSTPKADPSGDYAFEMFERIESTGALGPGSAAALKARALQLTGGPQSPAPPADRNVYGVLVSQGAADVFITYCTNAALAAKEQPLLQVLAVPDAVNVSASYGMAVLKAASPAGEAFTRYLLSEPAQRRLQAQGFLPP